MTSLIRILTLTTVLAGLLLIGYWRMSAGEQQRALAELRSLNQRLEESLAQRQQMVERLSRSRRVAHVRVTDQDKAADGSIERTRIDFIELNDHGGEIARQGITIPGDVLFVDAWTVKFDPQLVAEGDPMRGRSLVLLRRVYSDRLPAKDGIALDLPGAIPPAYAASDASQFERRVWESFWELARDPDAAAKLGVNVAQGEAVYKPVLAGETYELVVDAIGGMSLKPLSATALTRINE